MGQDVFVLPDGVRLPCRVWLPEGRPKAAVLALHGFNDSCDAWAWPAACFAASGVAVYAPDHRCFGAAPGRGLWPGAAALVVDAAEMARQVRARHPGVRLVLLGESMGAAVLMVLATGRLAPPDAAYGLIAPAVWGRTRMNPLLSGALRLAMALAPGMRLSPGPARVRLSDNRVALDRLASDPLVIRRTRVDALAGLVDLMDAAVAAAPLLRVPALLLYGGRDALVPSAAVAASWQALPRGGAGGPRIAYYPHGHHLLLRDLTRAVPIGDVTAWLGDPSAALPSGAEQAAERWLAVRGGSADRPARDPSFTRL